MEKRENENWLSELRTEGTSQETALADLRGIIVTGLRHALTKWLHPGEPQFESLIEEIAQETLLKVLDNLDSFEGRSQFTTWVHKIAVRTALTELRRKRWRDVSLDEPLENSDEPGLYFAVDPDTGTEVTIEQKDILEKLGHVINEELSEKQRRAMVGVAIQGMPLEEVARRMNTNRNALYKLLHDARLKLKKRFAKEGMQVSDIFATFEK
ncbi:MAG: RNA polymerase sigma factor [Anaerolineaceae bacterium]|nr:RNA polymerase sigma factor [Anaerolineaceae bacterium]